MKGVIRKKKKPVVDCNSYGLIRAEIIEHQTAVLILILPSKVFFCRRVFLTKVTQHKLSFIV